MQGRFESEKWEPKNSRESQNSHLGVVVSEWLQTGVPALLLWVRNSFQVSTDRCAAEIETLKTIFRKHNDLGSLRNNEPIFITKCTNIYKKCINRN